MRKFNAFILKVLGYKIDCVNLPPELKKCVLLFAPHTSYYDFLIGVMAISAMGFKASLLIKKEAFFWPLGPILRRCGGIPVDRKHVKKFPVYAANYIKEQDEIAFLISPEGTRALNKNWKKGFYFIACEAGVPIVPGYLDFRTKRGGVLPAYYPTGDYEKDLAELEKRYYGMHGLHKGKFNLEDKPYAFPEWLSEKERKKEQERFGPRP